MVCFFIDLASLTLCTGAKLDLIAYSELSFLDVKYFLKNFVGECDAIYVDTIPLLFKLVPLLLQYKRIPLARYVTGLVLLVDNLVLSKIKIPRY